MLYCVHVCHRKLPFPPVFFLWTAETERAPPIGAEWTRFIFIHHWKYTNIFFYNLLYNIPYFNLNNKKHTNSIIRCFFVFIDFYIFLYYCYTLTLKTSVFSFVLFCFLWDYPGSFSLELYTVLYWKSCYMTMMQSVHIFLFYIYSTYSIIQTEIQINTAHFFSAWHGSVCQCSDTADTALSPVLPHPANLTKVLHYDDSTIRGQCWHL